MSAYNELNEPSSGATAKLVLPDNSTISLQSSGRWIGRSDFTGQVSESVIQQISREHLFITMENGSFYCEDRSSTNGTRLNGQEISGTGRHVLKEGDTLVLGDIITVHFQGPVRTTAPSGYIQTAAVPYNEAPAAQDVHYKENTSGQGNLAIVPPEIKKWHWGAFFLNWIWGIGNNVWIALLCFVPMVNIVMIFILGARGNEWAWRNKRWDSIEHFKRVQHKWTAWGLGLFLAGIAINIIYFIAMASCMRSF